MPERIRLTIAALATVLLLAAVSAAGVALHTGAPTSTVSLRAPLTTQAAHAAPTQSRHEEPE
jgi:hypothetical protein